MEGRRKGCGGIKRVDEVIPVAPGVGFGAVALVAVGFGVANRVEPVSSPAFAVSRARKKIVHDALERGRRGIVEEPVLFFRSWWQANQIEIGPAKEGPAVRRRRRLQPDFF